jgi:hypothetical protein
MVFILRNSTPDTDQNNKLVNEGLSPRKDFGISQEEY